MTPKIEVKDVPADQVDQIVAHYKGNGATKVEYVPQGDGRYTVIATFSALPGEPKVPVE
jgi:hypothetical protein